MQNSSSASPAPKKSLRRRLLRYGIIGLLWIVTLVALLVVEENWRGKRAWERYKAELEAKGEHLDFTGLVPAPVPDDQNFAEIPFLAPLFNFNLNRKPGESAWADTNGLNRVQQFANDFPAPKTRDNWKEGHPMDLPRWAAAFSKNEKGEANVSALSRTQAAAEILRNMEKYQPVLEDLREGSKRPYSAFKLRYEDNIGTLVPHLAPLKKIAQLYQLQASAKLTLGQTDKAMEDIRMALYLADSIKGEPLLICKLVRIAIIQLALQPIWEGLDEHKWSEAQLAELQTALSRFNFVAEAADCFRGERALDNSFMDMLRTRRNTDWQSIVGQDGPPGGLGFASLRFTPSAFFYQNQLTVNRLYQDVSLPMVNPEKVMIHPAQDDWSVFDKELKKYALPYRIFAQLLFPAVQKSTMKIGFAQTAVDEATLACALQRYRSANHHVPSSLEELKPQFIARIPQDVINGEPLHYRRVDDQRFVLYSIGWNQKDDGGTTAFAKGSAPSVELREGDWVWPQDVAK